VVVLAAEAEVVTLSRIDCYSDGVDGDTDNMFPVHRPLCENSLILQRLSWSRRIQQTLCWSCDGSCCPPPSASAPDHPPLHVVVSREERDAVGDSLLQLELFTSYDTGGPTIPWFRTREMVDTV